jgi:succinate dehydrogenase / fumarate reductase flavoprotein subunit
MDRAWRPVTLLCRAADGGASVALDRVRAEPVRADLLALFEKEELAKYFAEEELEA